MNVVSLIRAFDPISGNRHLKSGVRPSVLRGVAHESAPFAVSNSNRHGRLWIWASFNSDVTRFLGLRVGCGSGGCERPAFRPAPRWYRSAQGIDSSPCVPDGDVAATSGLIPSATRQGERLCDGCD